MVYLQKHKKRANPQVARADIGYIRELAWVFERNHEDLFVAWPQNETPKELSGIFPDDDLGMWAIVVSYYDQDAIDAAMAVIPDDGDARALWERDFQEAKARERTLFEGQINKEELVPRT